MSDFLGHLGIWEHTAREQTGLLKAETPPHQAHFMGRQTEAGETLWLWRGPGIPRSPCSLHSQLPRPKQAKARAAHQAQLPLPGGLRVPAQGRGAGGALGPRRESRALHLLRTGWVYSRRSIPGWGFHRQWPSGRRSCDLGLMVAACVQGRLGSSAGHLQPLALVLSHLDHQGLL